MTPMRHTLLAALLALPGAALAGEPVTVETFVRAETDTAIRVVLKEAPMGTFAHIRTPVPVENQQVIRMNRDTLYSTAIADLSQPVTVTLPDGGGRYQSLEVINQDHYMYAITKPGTYTLTQDEVGTRFVYLLARTFVDPDDADDLAKTHAMQDGLKISGGGAGPFDAPDWDQDKLTAARKALNQVALIGFDTTAGFGRKDEVRPIEHLLAAASGWGGLPPRYATYEVASIADSSGTPHVVTVKDVPVDAFWSLTVYNADGYMEPNAAGVYNYNSVTAKPNADGSFTIHFGGCDDGRINCIPITKGWNYVARLYEPRAEILDGSWTFPAPVPVN